MNVLVGTFSWLIDTDLVSPEAVLTVSDPLLSEVVEFLDAVTLTDPPRAGGLVEGHPRWFSHSFLDNYE